MSEQQPSKKARVDDGSVAAQAPIARNLILASIFDPFISCFLSFFLSFLSFFLYNFFFFNIIYFF